MLAIRLPEEIENRLAELAARTGRTKTYYAREAILEHLGEMETKYLVIDRLEKVGKRWTNWSKGLIWKVEFDTAAAKELRKLDHKVQRDILHYFRERIATKEDPRRFGKRLLMILPTYGVTVSEITV